MVGAVAWENLCHSKAEGGIGFTDTWKRNIVTVSKLAWTVAQKNTTYKLSGWVRSILVMYNGVNMQPWIMLVGHGNIDAKIKMKWLWNFTLNSGWMMGISALKSNTRRLMGVDWQTQWSRFVWSRYTQLKHRIIMWLAMQDRLKTRLRLKNMNLCVDDSYIIC